MTPMLGIMASSISGSKISTSSFESIATITAAGGETSLSFTSIPQTYKSLQIRGISRDTSATNQSNGNYLTFNNDTGTNYHSHLIINNPAGAAYAYDSGNVNYVVNLSGAIFGSGTTNMFGSGIYDIIDYSSTTKNKVLRTFLGADTNGVTTIRNIQIGSGLWLSTSAITTITINEASAGFAAGSTFALYGIK